jgi:Domain of unknown function (DUF4062)/inactive STAND
MRKVYISSTFEDLEVERQTAIETVREFGHHVVAMEGYSAATMPSLDKCQRDVAECEAYIGIVGWCYGSIPEGQTKSFTHLEYEEATKKELPRLIFFLDTEPPVPKNDEQRRELDAVIRFRDELGRHTIAKFKTAEQLAKKISQAIYDELPKIPVPPRPSSSERPKREIPELLPHLTDRTKQIHRLRKAVEFSTDNKSRRPFVCVVHGDKQESHHMFCRRLVHKALPDLLRLDREVGIGKKELAWRPGSGKLEQQFDLLYGELSFEFTGRTSASKNEIQAAITNYGRPVFIEIHLSSSDLQDGGAQLIEKYLDLWASWPNVSPMGLIVVLAIQYEIAEGVSFLKKRKLNNIKAETQRFLERIDFVGHDRLDGVVCPEIESVSEEDVMDWARMEAEEYRCFDELSPKIRKLFEGPDDRIPMEQLATDLRTFFGDSDS